MSTKQEFEDVIRQLKTENSNYRKNFDNLKQAYQELELKTDSIKSKLELVNAEKIAADEEHDRTIQEWKRQVERQTEEFDDLKRELLPTKDLNVFRMQCLAEYHETSKEKFDFLKMRNVNGKDANKWKDLYMEVKKEFEAFQAKVHEKEMEYQTTLEDVSMTFQMKINHLQQKLSDKNDALDETFEIGVRLQHLQRENEELTIKTKGLNADLQKIEAELAEERANHHLQLQNYKRTIGEKEIMIQTVQTEIQTYKKRQNQLEDDIRTTYKHHDELQNDNINLRAEIGKLMAKIEQLNHQYNIERNDASFAFAKEKSALENNLKQAQMTIREKEGEVTALKMEISDINNQIHLVEHSCNESVQKSSRMERLHLEQISQLEKDYSSQLAQKDLNIKDCAHEIDSLKQANQNINNQSTALQLELQNAIKFKQEYESELTMLRERLEKTDWKLREAEETISKKEAEILTLRKKEDESANRIYSMQDHIVETEKKVIYLQDESEDHNHKLESKIRDALDNYEKLKQEKEDLEVRMKRMMLEKDGQISKIVSATRKLKNGYKERTQTMHDELSKLQVEYSQLKNMLDTENYEAQVQLREMFRRQKDFANLLKSEGLFPATK